jgi:hypothetical protein
MSDCEKVMSWLEGLAEPDWRECYSDSEVQETARQALDLIDELLKEQEAIKPVLDEQTGRIWLCGKCGSYVGFEDNDPHDPNEYDKYCRECGRPVLWEGC